MDGQFSSSDDSRYGADVTPRAIPTAAHQAAVEISLMQMLGKPLTSICTVSYHLGRIQLMINNCVVDGSETEQWNTALRFPDQQTMDALVFVFNQIGESTESKEIESPESFLVKEEASEPEAYRALSLADPTVKFAVRLPFPVITWVHHADLYCTVHQEILPADRPSCPRSGHHLVLNH